MCPLCCDNIMGYGQLCLLCRPRGLATKGFAAEIPFHADLSGFGTTVIDSERCWSPSIASSPACEVAHLGLIFRIKFVSLVEVCRN